MRRDTIVEYGRLFDLHALVETGLDNGVGSGMGAGFDPYIALDRDERNVKLALEQGYDARHGDSGSLMFGVLVDLAAPALFFLDAHGIDCHQEQPIDTEHWPGWDAMPLLRELETIAGWPYGAGSVVLVDDMPQMAKWMGVGLRGDPDPRLFDFWLDTLPVEWNRDLSNGILRLTP